MNRTLSIKYDIVIGNDIKYITLTKALLTCSDFKPAVGVRSFGSDSVLLYQKLLIFLLKTRFKNTWYVV